MTDCIKSVFFSPDNSASLGEDLSQRFWFIFILFSFYFCFYFVLFLFLFFASFCLLRFFMKYEVDVFTSRRYGAIEIVLLLLLLYLCRDLLERIARPVVSGKY